MEMISLEGKTNFFEKRAGEFFSKKMFFHSIAISKYFQTFQTQEWVPDHS